MVEVQRWAESRLRDGPLQGEQMDQQTQASQRSLVRKLSEVMGVVGRVPKNGRNDFHKYDYATEADIAEAVRMAMAERHLMLVPDVVDTTWHEVPRRSGGSDRIATLKVRFTLMDGDSGENMVFHVLGEGQDGGDKATYKAMTGAIKYALLKLFLIPTGDDPEIDATKPGTSGDVKRPAPERSAPKQSAQPQRQQSGPQQPAPSTTPRGGGSSPLVPFGKNKGMPISSLADKDLDWHIDKAAEAVAKNDERWHAKNKAWLEALQDERDARSGQARQTAPGAKAETSAGSPYERLVAKLGSMGVPENEYRAELKKRGRATSKSVTDDDVDALVKFFSGSDEPPPPGDEDAPWGDQ